MGIFHPISLMHQLSGVTKNFKRLNMRTTYVCHGLTSPRVKFCSNQKMSTKNYLYKFVGGRKKKNSCKKYHLVLNIAREGMVFQKVKKKLIFSIFFEHLFLKANPSPSSFKGSRKI